MLRIALCDDEQEARDCLRFQLEINGQQLI